MLAALGLATLPAVAPTTPTDPPSGPIVFTAFDEEEWEFEEECFEEEFEVLCEEEDDEEGDPRASECPLRSTNAHATANHDRLKVTVGYTTWHPTAATIRVGRGATGLGTFKRRLGRSGVLRFTGKPAKRHGKRLVVSVRVPSAGRYCEDDAAVLFK